MLSRLLLVLLTLVPSLALGEMYKCRRSDGMVVLTNIACGPADTVISIDGVSPKEIKRLQNAKNRMAAEEERVKAVAEERQRQQALEQRTRAQRAGAPAERVDCEIEHRGGKVQKIVTYSTAGNTYAINGQARSRAPSRGWIDGFARFSPEQMQRLLQQGLSKC